jgi:hypothetical protein
MSRLSALATIPASNKGSSLARLHDRGEQALRSTARTLLAPLRSTGGYAKQKFPGLAREEVEALVERYRGLTGRFGAVKVRPAHSNIFAVSAL